MRKTSRPRLPGLLSICVVVAGLTACSSSSAVAPAPEGPASRASSNGAHRATNSLDVLYSFHSGGHDGLNPRGGVFVDAAGNIFGTTVWGGTEDWGTVYE